jgi:hypothetical protein
MATTKRRTLPRKSKVDLGPSVQDYLLNRSMRERSEYHEGRIKKELMGLLEASGKVAGTNGNKRVLELDDTLTFVSYKDGKPVDKKIVGVERRERTSNVLNQDKAMALLEKKRLVAECTETITVLKEDAILAANYSGAITDKELASLYEESSSFAFWLTEE